MTVRDTGTAGSQARATRGAEREARNPQDTDRPGYDTPELEMPGAPSDREIPSSSNAGDAEDTRQSQETSELTELTLSKKESEPSVPASSSPPRRRARVEGEVPEAEDRGLSEEQTNVFNTARNTLTDADCERIDRRYINIAVNAMNVTSNEEANTQEGGSNLKGKGADPRNWGGVQLSGHEMDLETQRQILQSYNDAAGQDDQAGDGEEQEFVPIYEEDVGKKERRQNRRMVNALLQAS
ncbi:hypothetical protein C0993_008172 [Termitomyces sp. T159_Od127]|nr:hypothetical protein C0993_008172 [Termitomyces sp. T159_Od127]